MVVAPRRKRRFPCGSSLRCRADICTSRGIEGQRPAARPQRRRGQVDRAFAPRARLRLTRDGHRARCDNRTPGQGAAHGAAQTRTAASFPYCGRLPPLFRFNTFSRNVFSPPPPAVGRRASGRSVCFRCRLGLVLLATEVLGPGPRSTSHCTAVEWTAERLAGSVARWPEFANPTAQAPHVALSESMGTACDCSDTTPDSRLILTGRTACCQQRRPD